MATTGWHSHRHRRSHGPACKELGNYIHCRHWHFDLCYMIVQDCLAMEMNCVIQLLCSIDRQVIYPLAGDLPIGIAQQSWLLAQYLAIANAIGNGNVDSWMNRASLNHNTGLMTLSIVGDVRTVTINCTLILSRVGSPSYFPPFLTSTKSKLPCDHTQ